MLEPEIIFNSANNIETFKSETLFNFDPYKNSIASSTEPLFRYDDGKYGRSFEDMKISTSPKLEQVLYQQPSNKNTERSIGKKHIKKKKHKFQKCIYKLFKGKRKTHKFLKMKKLMISIFLGILVAKSLFIPIVLKALALLTAKGLMFGFFSTVMAFVVNLKGVFSHPYGHRNRKDDGKTRVEIVHIPGKDDNLYYDRPFRRKFVANYFNKEM